MDLIEHEWIKISRHQLLLCLLKIDHFSQLTLKSPFLLLLLELREPGLSDLDLNLITCGELVLDMLRATVAAEDASSHHDSHLGG